jgi:hypothetical protein
VGDHIHGVLFGVGFQGVVVEDSEERVEEFD